MTFEDLGLYFPLASTSSKGAAEEATRTSSRGLEIPNPRERAGSLGRERREGDDDAGLGRGREKKRRERGRKEATVGMPPPSLPSALSLSLSRSAKTKRCWLAFWAAGGGWGAGMRWRGGSSGLVSRNYKFVIFSRNGVLTTKTSLFSGHKYGVPTNTGKVLILIFPNPQRNSVPNRLGPSFECSNPIGFRKGL